jgi:hypothetical protein
VAEQPKVVRASQAGSPAASNVSPLKTDFRTQAPLPPVAKPEPEPVKRSKSERTHEGRGWWAGFAHGILVGAGAGAFLMFLGFLAGAPILADFSSRMEMVRVARDAALNGK